MGVADSKTMTMPIRQPHIDKELLKIMKKSIFFTLSLAFALAAYAASPSETLKKAEAGDAEAQNAVGEYLYHGIEGMSRDYGKALQWWAAAAKQGNAKAIGNMGMCYRYGHGCTPDSLKAVRLYLKSIRSGNDSLQTYVEQSAQRGVLFDNIVTALAYKSGIGVERSGEKALRYYQLAADGGSADAQRELALIKLNTGHPDEAAQWFEKAAAQGDLSSTYFSGMMRMKGMGVAVDQVTGLQLIQNAADRDFPQACYDLSQRYDKGDGVEADSAKAVSYLRHAAITGSHRAQWDYATALRDGRNMPCSYSLAYDWMAIAVNQGYTADFKATYCDPKNMPVSTFFTYLKGNAYAHIKDYDNAIKCFDRVIADGITDGMVAKALAITLRSEGNPTDEERQECADLLKKAAETNPKAKLLLAYLITMGRTDLTDQETDESIELMIEAADAGDPLSLNALGELYNTVGEEFYSSAAACFEAAHKMGMLNHDLAVIYAKYLREGLGGVSIDKEKADLVEKRALPQKYHDRMLKMLVDTWIPKTSDTIATTDSDAPTGTE